MIRERRSQIEVLYKAALDIAPSERDAFLRDACGADDSLRAEIEARLRQTTGDFEETRSVRAAPPARTGEWAGLRLIAEIGAGGFGRVFRARDQTLARDVALKIISLKTHEDAATVLREGQMLARVRHRNVVTVHAAQRVGDEVGVTMELVDGQNLADLVRLNGPMGAEEAAVIGLSVCQAVAAVHAAGLVHRDVKARNVMRERGGRIVLMDFGLGLDLAGATDVSAAISGTPPYIAPELFDGRIATPASDLYSVGVLLFFLVTGDYPVPAGTVTAIANAHASGERRYLADLRPDLPAPFVRVVEQALSPDPAHRYATAGAMMQALADAIPDASAERRAAGAARAGARTAATTPEAGMASRWSPVVWAGRSAAVLLGIGLLGFVTSISFNATLNRTGGFSDDTPAAWLELGARSLVTPLIYTLLIVGALVAARTSWRVLRLALRPVADRSEASVRRVSRVVGLGDPAGRAQWLLVAQAVGFALFVWRFYDVFQVLTDFPDFIDPAVAAGAFSERSDRPLRYRQALAVVLIGAAVGWRSLLNHPLGQHIDAGTKAGALFLSIVMLLTLSLPYRLMFHSDRPVVRHAGLRCYDLGRQDTRVLVYCPAWDPPRIRSTSVAGVEETGVREHVFNAEP